MSEENPTIERLEWDSTLFGFGVGRVRAKRLTIQDAARCADEARRLGLRCLYLLASSDDPTSWAAAIRAGFEPIDIRIELDRELAPEKQVPRDGSLATEHDLPCLLELARGAFTESRFFRDERFPSAKAEELFSIWVRRGVYESDRFTLLSREDGKPAGFVSGWMAAAGRGRIELVAVARAFQGRGVGHGLLDCALAEFARRGAGCIAVVTQGSNVSAQRLYQRAGFRTGSVDVWFHGWY
jgi:dTDP-4-amino-4,6-dideoxy-D-galactose acyltransferase